MPSSVRRLLACIVCLGAACEPRIEVGSLVPSDAMDADAGTMADTRREDGSSPTDAAGDGMAGPDVVPIFPLPFATEFEDPDFQEWTGDGRICYQPNLAERALVTDPVHGGTTSSVFRTFQGTSQPAITRCSLRGILKAREVWFRAFFYVPSPLPTIVLAVGMSSWNILHFSDASKGLLDVNFILGSDGSLSLGLWDEVTRRQIVGTRPVLLPVDRWFELQVHWTRTTDASGGWEIYRDGTLVLEANTPWSGEDYAEFHIGNLTNFQTVPVVNVYVDDLTVSTAPP